MKSESAGHSPDPVADATGGGSPIIEHAPLPMLEVEGARHVVCFANGAFCRLVRKTREELIGQPFEDLVRNGKNCVALLDRIYETGTFETHVDTDESGVDAAYWLYAMWPTLGTDERPRRVVIQLTTAPHFRENAAAVNEALLIAGLREHSLREEAEKSSDRSRAEIAVRIVGEATLREANARLLIATGTAERANQAKDNFLAALSHELRTPLTPVLIAAAALRADTRLPDDVREQLGMMERNIALEARLIDDLLDLTKISQGKLRLRPELCDAHALIGLAIEFVQETAREKDIAIERIFTARHSQLRADSARFQQIIWNLLRNAVKFTPPGGAIAIRTQDGPDSEPGKWLRIEVSDTGIGIEPGRLDQIFQPFDQGGLTGDHRFGGVGLGLAIARAVVNMHDGRIAAQSAGPNRGATFVVELPRALEPRPGAEGIGPPSPPPPLAAGAPVRPLRLLLVEDHPSTLRILAKLLGDDGHQVTAVSRVAEALGAAKAQRFDLVVSDLGLPDGTGDELMATLRDAHGLRGIALSGYGMEEDLARSTAAGFVIHLVKPVSSADLRRAIACLTPPG